MSGGPKPPFIFLNPDNQRSLPRNPFHPRQPLHGPIAFTKLGPVRGFKMRVTESREIFAFTGVPYGESTAGKNRFSDPVPRRPWGGTWDATFPSPYCVQRNSVNMGRLSGKEDCLFLDIYTPRLPSKTMRNDTGSLLPVIIWSPAGIHYYGRSRFYGPKYFLREDVILVPINIRYGVFGFFSTGDEISPGNAGLRDQGLAIQWVHEHIRNFGGDPNRIVLGGLSSGGTDSHMMLFVNHPSRKLLKGIIAQSGTAFYTYLDTAGRVRRASDKVAEGVNCPKSTKGGGNSRKMVECLRKIDPKILLQQTAMSSPRDVTFPPEMFNPTLEFGGNSSFLSRKPEEVYKSGDVPPIPVIITRTSRESCGFLTLGRGVIAPVLSIPQVYNFIFPKVFKMMGTSGDRNVSEAEGRKSLEVLNRIYFNKNTTPNLLRRKEWWQFCDMLTDAGYTAPMWKAIEMHHKLAPSYAYVLSLQADISQVTRLAISNRREASHGTDYVFLFNNSRLLPPHQPGSAIDKASRRLINMLVNFATYGTPYYRNSEGKLLNIWKPVTDMRNPVALDVGLVNGIEMTRDPVALLNRWRVWDQLRF
ncbi:Esterase FE4 [Orchesella cincta]|uniref:Carboxylic ester hydrolase n=1 Tax=Orchesella cincta TaxID=48709 RepID=A0A1D2MKU8_ORCCI|nr:Esterase FE4 [Orchesella cincta]